MAKQKAVKKAEPLAPVCGALLSACVWTAGALALAGAAALGALREEGSFPILAALAVLSALIGGGYAARRGGLGAALAAAGGFASFLAAAGLLLWSRFGWLGHGGILLACVLAGGLCAGAFGGGGKTAKKRRRR